MLKVLNIEESWSCRSLGKVRRIHGQPRTWERRRLVKKQINVVGAVIVKDGEILCAQRGPGGSLPNMWEFPGGKVEENETPREGLIREISEELKCRVEVGDEVATTTHQYDFGTVTLTTFYCELIGGSPQLTEHAEVRWLAPECLEHLDWAPADIEAVQALKENAKRAKTQTPQAP